MNGKREKLLRKQAKEVSFTNDLPTCKYMLEWHNKVYIDMLTSTPKGYKVYTSTLDLCERSIYQELKKNFKSKA